MYARRINALGSAIYPAYFRRHSSVDLMQSLLKCQDWRESIDILNAVKLKVLPSPHAYNATLRVISRAGEWKAALNLIEEQKKNGTGPNLHNICTAMSVRQSPIVTEIHLIVYPAPSLAWLQACNRGRRSDKAIELFESIPDLGLKADAATLNSAMYSYSMASRFDEALKIFESMELKWGVRPDSHSFSAAMRACGGAKRLQAILGLLDEAKANGFPLDHYIINAALEACLRCNESEMALKLFDSMEDLGIQPDVATFSIAIKACQKSDDADRALQLFASMKKMGIAPNNWTFTALITIVSKAGEWERAIHLFDSMELYGVTPHIVNCNAAITACARGGNWARAFKILDSCPSLGLSPDVYTYTAVIQACKKHGKWREALSLLPAVPQPSIVTFNELMSICAKCGRWDEVVDLLDKLVAAGLKPSVSTYNSFIHTCSRHGDYRTAVRIFRTMENQGLTPDLISWGSLLAACKNGASVIEAEALLDEMTSKGTTPNTTCINAAISCCLRDRDWEKALQLLGTMRTWKLKRTEVTVNAVLQVMDASGRREESCELMLEARNRGMFKQVWAQDDLVDLLRCPTATAHTALRVILHEIRVGFRSGELGIIAGRGKLGWEVRSLLSREGPAYSEAPRNPGRITISAEAIKEWKVHGEAPRL